MRECGCRLIPGIEFATRAVPVTRPLASSLNWRDFTKDLPYFRWYPADAETDEKYSAMTDAEVGFYHRCLNRSWINGGLPADLSELLKTMRISATYLAKVWPRVGQCFEISGDRLINRRQENDREKAIEKSAQSSRAVAERERKRNLRSSVDVSSDVSVDDPRALAPADSVCVSSLVLESKNRNQNQVRAREPEPGGLRVSYALFWIRWCELTKRKQRESYGLQAWISVMDVAMIAAAMACLERYGLSGEVQRGAVTNVDRWIYDQARDNFTGEWQPEPQALSPAERKSKAMREAVAKLDEEEENGYRQ